MNFLTINLYFYSKFYVFSFLNKIIFLVLTFILISKSLNLFLKTIKTQRAFMVFNIYLKLCYISTNLGFITPSLISIIAIVALLEPLGSATLPGFT